MKCVTCKTGDTKKGLATFTFERDGAVFVFRSVPADICQNCEEKYLDGDVAEQLYEAVEEESKSGTTVIIREFAPVGK